jgi:hypothetical protein
VGVSNGPHDQSGTIHGDLLRWAAGADECEPVAHELSAGEWLGFGRVVVVAERDSRDQSARLRELQRRAFESFIRLIPDGQPFDRQEFAVVTPGATNNATSAPLVVRINEWMAGNTTTIADPADGDFEDWFELYNPGDSAVDLAGYFLTDDLSNRTQYQITTSGAHTIPARGYLLVWADSETGQNLTAGVPRPDLHVNFRLAASGEAIGLFAADGTQIDAVTFTNQVDDVSEGRFPGWRGDDSRHDEFRDAGHREPRRRGQLRSAVQHS